MYLKTLWLQVPARIIKEIDEQTQQKTALEEALRTL
jgi:2,3,4,5-tetrahydropyridine-2-carboxylate N-succinyltransferase